MVLRRGSDSNSKNQSEPTSPQAVAADVTDCGISLSVVFVLVLVLVFVLVFVFVLENP